MIKAVFFDFNGVILDDEMIQMKSYQEVLRSHSIDLTEEMYFAGLGMDDRTFLRSIFARSGKPLTDPLLGSVIEAKTSIHRDTIKDELPLFPGVLT
ncbi:MAG: beta-phosphoglucomutase, partial [Acidobacteriota bacterium]